MQNTLMRDLSEYLKLKDSNITQHKSEFDINIKNSNSSTPPPLNDTDRTIIVCDASNF